MKKIEDKLNLEPIWFPWVYHGKILDDAPVEVKKAYREEMEFQRKQDEQKT